MGQDFSRYVLRDPRHQSTDVSKAWMELFRSGDRLPERLPAVLVDLSRQGMQFRVALPLQLGETIKARLVNDGLDLMFEGTVQWQRAGDNTTYTVGCQFEEQVALESLGELFLGGILDQENAS